MRRVDRLHLECPFAGSRMLRGLLAAEGCKIGQLTLENDFLEGALSKAGLLSAKR